MYIQLLPVSDKQVRLAFLRAMDAIDAFTTYAQLDKYRDYLRKIVLPQLRNNKLFTHAHTLNRFITDKALKLINIGYRTL